MGSTAARPQGGCGPLHTLLAGCAILPNFLPVPALPGPRSTPVPAGVGRVQALERDGFGMTRSLPLSGQPESHRGCRVFPKLFRRLREPSPGHCAARAHVGSLRGHWGCGGSSLSGNTRSTKSPGRAGVLGSSCPADSQQLVWCEQRFSDHLLAVGGAGSTAPWHSRGTSSYSCPGAADSHWVWAAALELRGCLRSLKTNCCIPGRAHTAGSALPLLPPAFPPCTQALEEPVRALRAELPPCPPARCLRGEGRKGTVGREVLSSLLWCGLVLPSPCQSRLVPWGWGCAGPFPNSAATGTLVGKLDSSVSPPSDLCSNHGCAAAQLCRCNQDQDGVI